MLLLVVLCLAATFHFDALAHAVQEDSVRNVWKILEYQTEQSKASPQFVFGVSIGVQLLIGSKQNLDPDIKQLIRQMLTIVDDFQKSCGVHDDCYQMMINPSFWMKEPLEPTLSVTNKTFPWTSIDEYLNHMNSGHPFEWESDYCLKLRMESSCRRDSVCDSVMSLRPVSYGYRATHKLLYWIVCRQKNCSVSNGTMSEICSSIYAESRLIISQHPLFVDLFMEQFLLCGLMGYKDFLTHSYLNLLNEFLTALECPEDPLCNAHTSGVAIAVLCFMVVVF